METWRTKIRWWEVCYHCYGMNCLPNLGERATGRLAQGGGISLRCKRRPEQLLVMSLATNLLKEFLHPFSQPSSSLWWGLNVFRLNTR